MEFFADIFGFFKKTKKYWMLPVLLVTLALGALIVFSSGSAVAPFIYTLF
jgi:hypothetical protein